MAKKKKKKNVSAVKRSNPKNIYLNYNKNKDGTTDVYKTVAMPEHRFTEIFDLNRSNIIDMTAHTSSVEKLKTICLEETKKWCQTFVSKTQGLDQILNMDNNLEIINQPVFDTIDFSEFVKSNDLYKTVNDIINSEDFEYDPSYLFSPSQYFEIIFSENIKFRCKRVEYNIESQTTEYQVIMYYRFMFKFDENNYEEQWLPVFEMSTSAIPAVYDMNNNAVISISDSEDNQKNPEQCQFKIDSHTVFGMTNASIFENYENTYGKIFKTINTLIFGANGLRCVIGYTQYNCKNLSKGDSKLLISCLAECYMTHVGIENMDRPYTTTFGHEIKNPEILYKYKECCEFMEVSTMLHYAVFYINKLLKDKKLGHLLKNPPAKMYQKISAVDNYQNENQTDTRQTRILGENIYFKSEKRPETPTMERIIKYSTPEWSRKEHLRKLPSGKVIKVKSSTCKRHCMDNPVIIKSKPKTKATDYKIKGAVK